MAAPLARIHGLDLDAPVSQPWRAHYGQVGLPTRTKYTIVRRLSD